MGDLVTSSHEGAGMPGEVYNCPCKDRQDPFGMLLWFTVGFCTLRFLSVVHSRLRVPRGYSSLLNSSSFRATCSLAMPGGPRHQVLPNPGWPLSKAFWCAELTPVAGEQLGKLLA